jgi:hypothetical protein
MLHHSEFRNGVPDGYALLCGQVSARCGQLLRFTESVDARRIPHERLLQPELLSKEALTTIVVGIAEGLKALPVFLVQGFVMFQAPTSKDMGVVLEPGAATMLSQGQLFHPQGMEPLLGTDPKGYWYRAFERGADTSTVRGVVSDLLAGLRQKEAASTVPLWDRDRVAEIVVTGFFAALMNALAITKRVEVGGLGALEYRGTEHLGFEPDRALRESVQVRELRALTTWPEPTMVLAGGAEVTPVAFDVVMQETRAELEEITRREEQSPRAADALLRLFRSFYRRPPTP